MSPEHPTGLLKRRNVRPRCRRCGKKVKNFSIKPAFRLEKPEYGGILSIHQFCKKLET